MRAASCRDNRGWKPLPQKIFSADKVALHAALALSTLTGHPFRAERVRQIRPIPGHKPQHQGAGSKLETMDPSFSIASLILWLRGAAQLSWM